MVRQKKTATDLYLGGSNGKVCLARQSVCFLCPVDEDFKPLDGAFADPNNCAIYYHCINGTSYSQQCPPGLVFTISVINCEYSTCVEPKDSKCPGDNQQQYSRSFPQCSQSNPVAKDLSGTCYKTNVEDCPPNRNGTFPNRFDCRQYFHCVNGQQWPQQCPNGYFFSPDLNVRDCSTRMCVPFEEAECPISGGWSSWSAWQNCQPSCGSGTRVRTRKCDNPPPSNGGFDCLGNEVDVEPCENDPCINTVEPAFLLSNIRTERFDKFNRVNFNNLNIYNSSTNRLTIRKSGIYVFSLTAGANHISEVNLRLAATPTAVGLIKGSQFDNARGPLVKSRIIISSLTPLSSPYVPSHTAGLYFSTEAGKETAWSGFYISTTTVLFASSSRRETNTGEISLPATHTLRNVIVISNSFIVGSSDMYYIQFGAGTSYLKDLEISVFINTAKTNSTLIRIGNSDILNDQFSRGFLIHLQSNDRITLHNNRGAIRSSSNNNELYLCALALNRTREAFYAYRTTDFSSSAYRKINFDKIEIDEGNSWNSATMEYVSQVDNLFHVDFSIGVGANIRGSARVVVDGIEVLAVRRGFTVTSTIDTVSRSGLVRLNIGSRLSIQGEGDLKPYNSQLISLTLFPVSSLNSA
ncbi:DgyrCDS14811 [Dimorphilus gyrociliatus]|uniref:DgyrCDS14811 n=1 Tax=Dimorphilus gyrociliatus TaxID=2664684 RepID=A0A7I8WF59_9ANNE|nr:DgyrCDS14811 [Dimorphilus gyrociliatus]